MKWALPILALILLTACGAGESTPREVPRGVLSKDSMAYYLSQVHIIDAAMRQREVRKENLQVYAKQGFIEYFDTAQIDRERFLRSLDFWGADFDDMSEVYDMSMERLSLQAARIKMKSAAESEERKRERSR